MSVWVDIFSFGRSDLGDLELRKKPGAPQGRYGLEGFDATGSWRKRLPHPIPRGFSRFWAPWTLESGFGGSSIADPDMISERGRKRHLCEGRTSSAFGIDIMAAWRLLLLNMMFWVSQGSQVIPRTIGFVSMGSKS